MKRLALYSGIVLAVLALVAAIGWWWLTATRSGAAFVLGQADARLEAFDYSPPRGSIAGGLEIDRLSLRQAGLEVDLGQVELAARVRLLPLRVRIEWLRAGRVDVRLPPAAPAPETTEPFRLGEVLGDFSAPLVVEVDELELRNIVVRSGDTDEQEPAPLIELRRLALAGRYSEDLALERAVVEGPSWRAELYGNLGLASPWQVALDTELELELDGDSSQQLALDLNGPLDSLDLRLEARGPARLDGEGSLGGVLDTPETQIQLSVSGGVGDWPGLPPRLENLTLRLEGGLTQWRSELAGRVLWPDQPEAELDLALEGLPDQIRITRGNVNALDGRVLLTGQLDLPAEDAPMQANASLGWDGLNPGALVPEWPEQARLGGAALLGWDGIVLTVSDLRLQAPPTSLRVSGNAALNTESTGLDLGLEWQSLRWPLVDTPGESPGTPLFSSESGRLDGSGTLDEWRAELQALLSLPDQPQARLELRADGDSSVVRLREGGLRFDRAGGAEFSGQVALGDSPSASLDLRLDRFDPGAFVAELPGRLNGRVGLDIEGFDPLRIALELDELDGVLRQVPVSGSGRAALAGALVEQGQLDLRVGENSVALSSADGQSWQLELDAERLNQLWPALSGGLRASARVAPLSTQVDWTLSSAGLAWGAVRSGAVESTGTLNWSDAPSVDLSLNAVDVDLNPWERLDRVEVLLEGDCASHRLRGYVGGNRATVDLEAQGRLPDCLDNPSRWRGALQRLQVAETPVGAWQLDGPLEIVNDDQGLRAGPGCLWTTSSAGRLCLNELDAGESGTARLAFNSVPIDMVLLAADPVFTLGSDLKGLARVDWNSQGVQQIESVLLMGPGALRMLDSDEDLLEIRGAELVLDSPEPRGLNARLQLLLEQQSEINATAVIPDLSELADTRFDARAELLLANLGAVNRLLPQLDQLGGRLEASLQARGALASPELDGRVAIQDGRFFYAPLGSRVQELNLVLEADEQGGELDGSFSAGEGHARISGRLESGGETGWAGQASIAGEQLLMFNADWLEMTVTPDLQIGFTSDLLELDGSLAIDRARLGLPPGAESRVPVSEDVVIVNGADATNDDAPPPRDIAGTVQLRLGDDTRLEAAGMETRLAGTLDVEWTPGEPLPAGRGLIQLVDGSYRAYGQNLEVAVGDVMFTGNPIDNPMLEIEAVREIFGDPQVEQAGVRIRGPARDPEISLFTAPPTSREKALAYILTGADFDHAAGQGAFSVGFWVLPQVFVSYGLGLFDSGNVLAARWELSQRWGLRATSGERDTGADISFIIDR